MGVVRDLYDKRLKYLYELEWLLYEYKYFFVSWHDIGESERHSVWIPLSRNLLNRFVAASYLTYHTKKALFSVSSLLDVQKLINTLLPLTSTSSLSSSHSSQPVP